MSRGPERDIRNKKYEGQNEIRGKILKFDHWKMVSKIPLLTILCNKLPFDEHPLDIKKFNKRPGRGIWVTKYDHEIKVTKELSSLFRFCANSPFFHLNFTWLRILEGSLMDDIRFLIPDSRRQNRQKNGIKKTKHWPLWLLVNSDD